MECSLVVGLLAELDLGLDSYLLQVTGPEVHWKVGILGLADRLVFSQPFNGGICLDYICTPDQKQGASLRVDLNVFWRQHRVSLLHQDLLGSQHVLRLETAHMPVDGG
jgi:hypothetical protein